MHRTVLQLSDLHLAADTSALVHGADPDERLRTVLTAWRASGGDADLVLLTGDLADDGTPQAYRRLAAVVSDLGIATLAIPGNHDDPDLVARHFATPDVTSLGMWQIVCVDTSRPGDIHGTVDVSTLDALLATAHGPTLIAMHHPPVSRSTHPHFGLEGAGALLACLQRRPHVRGVISGHTHDALDATVDSHLQLLGCPSTLVGIAHDGDEHTVGGARTGARILELEDSGELVSRVLVA